MKINIRRGANQIGGSAVEVTADTGERIVLDIGIPLDAENNTPDLLPDIVGLREKTDDLLAVLISHGHADHYGCGKWIDKKIPVYMSDAANKFMHAQKSNLDRMKSIRHDCFVFENVRTIRAGETFQIGPFTITAYGVDHAAYDSFAFLISADNQKLFYTGDFRAHGRESDKTNSLFQNPPRDVDVMLMEGSSLDRLSPDAHFETEDALENKFYDVCKNTRGLVLVHQSSQNIDRIVSVYNAAMKSGRELVMTPYTGNIMLQTGDKNLPNFSLPHVLKLKEPAKRRYEITFDDIAKNPGGYVYITTSNVRDLLAHNLLNEHTAYVYSMWGGYREQDSIKKVIDAMTKHNVELHSVHTSGHADTPTLRRMVASIRPKVLVPIHTFHPRRYKNLFGDLANVQTHPDNTEFSITDVIEKSKKMTTAKKTKDTDKKADSAATARTLDAQFMFDLGDERGLLHPILCAVRDNEDNKDLSLQIRSSTGDREYINIYYMGGNVIKIKHDGKRGAKNSIKNGVDAYLGSINSGYTGYKPENPTISGDYYIDTIKTQDDAKRIAQTFAARKAAIKEWFYDSPNNDGGEKEFQQKLFHSNNSGDFLIIDTEIQIPRDVAKTMFKRKPLVPLKKLNIGKDHKPRFDMVAIEHIGNGAYRPVLIENKWGKGVNTGDCNIAQHAYDYCSFIASEYWTTYLKHLENQAIQMAKLGLIKIPTKFFYLDFKAAPQILFIMGDATEQDISAEMMNNFKKIISDKAWSKISIAMQFFDKDSDMHYDGNPTILFR